MVRIVVFDSGLGSLSVIKSIQKQMKCNVIYFADSKNFPYGKKSIKEIRRITLQTISTLQNSFKPELIVVGSNTLSFTLNTHSKNIIPVLPPLNEAKRINLLDDYMKNFKTNNIKIIKVNASHLVELVEHGKFYSNPKLCEDIIKKTLGPILVKNKVDVVTLSSTHLPFLLKFFENIFSDITFLDPSELLAKKLKQKYFNSAKRNSLQVFTSGSVVSLQKKLGHLGIKNKISKFTIE
jgi:glutamate racemase